MAKCRRLIFTEKGWMCTKFNKIIRDRDRCISGKNSRKCIEPIDPDEVDRAYEEIREEQKEEWNKLPGDKKIKLLKALIEETKQIRRATRQFRDGKEDEGDYNLDLKGGMIWLEKRT